MKVGIISSTGGHLTQALSIMEAFENQECFLVIHNFPTVKKFNSPQFKRIYRLKILYNYSLGIKLTTSRSIWLGVYLTLFKDIFELIKIFLKEKPDILFSTGSEIAIPAFFVGKYFFGTKLIYLESFSRIKNLSLTGKVLYRISDLFLVQWPDLLKKTGPKAFYHGRLV